jgi:hypothetical protein
LNGSQIDRHFFKGDFFLLPNSVWWKDVITLSYNFKHSNLPRQTQEILRKRDREEQLMKRDSEKKKEKASHQKVYHLEINGNESHNSFEFSNLEEVERLFSTLREQFSNYEITMNQARENDFVQLTYSPVYLDAVPNTIAPIVPNKLYSANVYEDMLTVAREKHGNKK